MRVDVDQKVTPHEQSPKRCFFSFLVKYPESRVSDQVGIVKRKRGVLPLLFDKSIIVDMSTPKRRVLSIN